MGFMAAAKATAPARRMPAFALALLLVAGVCVPASGAPADGAPQRGAVSTSAEESMRDAGPAGTEDGDPGGEDSASDPGLPADDGDEPSSSSGASDADPSSSSASGSSSEADSSSSSSSEAGSPSSSSSSSSGSGSGSASSSSSGSASSSASASASRSSSGSSTRGGSGSASQGSSGRPSASSSTSSSTRTGDKLDPAALPDGSYTVPVSLMKATNLDEASMAAAAFDGVCGLAVKGGTYTLSVKLGTVKLGSIVGHVQQVGLYKDYRVASGRLKTSGEATTIWRASGKSDSGPVPIVLPAAAKANGYVAIQLFADAMGDVGQDAALHVDWSKLRAVPGASSSASSTGASGSSKPSSSSKSSASSKSAKSSKSSKPSQSSKGSKSPKGSESSGSSKTPRAGSSSSSAASGGGTSARLEQGHAYRVPITITKAGSSQVSMANQYFGDTAVVRLQEGGTLDVRFSTNRADYISSLRFNGSAAAVVGESGNSREYRIVVPAGMKDRTLRLNLAVKPMQELGAGDVDADLHLYLTRAEDLGGDSGQKAPAGASGGDAAAGSGESSPASTPAAASGAAVTDAGATLAANTLPDLSAKGTAAEDAAAGEPGDASGAAGAEAADAGVEAADADADAADAGAPAPSAATQGGLSVETAQAEPPLRRHIPALVGVPLAILLALGALSAFRHRGRAFA